MEDLVSPWALGAVVEMPEKLAAPKSQRADSAPSVSLFYFRAEFWGGDTMPLYKRQSSPLFELPTS